SYCNFAVEFMNSFIMRRNILACKMYKLYRKIKSIYRGITNHFQVIYSDLDPVKECSKDDPTECVIPSIHSRATTGKLNRHYLFPLLVMCFITLDNVWVLCHYKFNIVDYEIPELFTHKLFLKQFWSFGDVIMNLEIYG